MDEHFDKGYLDGLSNAGDEVKEDTIDEISLSDGWAAASDYEDGYQEGQEDRDYRTNDYDSYDGYDGYDGDYDDCGGDGDYDY